MAVKSYLKEGKKYFLVEVKTRDSNGKQIYRSRQGLTSERKAIDAEYELKRELEVALDRKPNLGWQSWLSTCVERMKLELRPSTIENYHSYLGTWVTPVWKERDLREITKTDVYQMVFENFPQTKSMHSRKTLHKLIKRVFQMAVEDGMIDRNPAVGLTVRVPEVDQKVLTTSEVETFLSEAKTTQHRFYPIWVAALMTGMRSGELFGLEWNDIDFENRIIRVTKQWTSKSGFGPTKTQKARVVPISESFSVFLKEWKLKRDPSVNFVLPQLSEWICGEQAKVTREFCAAIGITPVKFHDLRATFITNLLASGVSLARVMAIVGHTQIKTTNGYLRKAGVEIKGATEELTYSVPTTAAGVVLKMANYPKLPS